jgi:hypothetical protein
MAPRFWLLMSSGSKKKEPKCAFLEEVANVIDKESI